MKLSKRKDITTGRMPSGHSFGCGTKQCIMEELMGNKYKKEMAEKHNREYPIALPEKEQRAIGIVST